MLSLITFSVSIVLTGAALPKFHDSRNLSPDQFGLYHTEAFDRLGEKMAMYPPSNRKAVIQDLEDILSSYCFDDNEECMLNAHRSVLQTEDLSFSFADTRKLDNLDISIKLYLDSVYAEILSIELKGFEQVLESLQSIQIEMTEMSGINEEDKRLGLAATSIAIESTKLWNQVLNDSDHPLNLLKNASNGTPKNNNGHNVRRRNLQASIENIMAVDIAIIILIDFIACLACYGNIFVAIGASFFAFLISLDPEKPELTVPSFFGCVDSIFFPNLPNVAPFFPVMSPTTTPTASPTMSSASSGLPSQSPVPSSTPSVAPSTGPSSAPSMSLLPSSSASSPSSAPSSSPQPSSSSLPSSSPQPSMSSSSFPSISLMPSVSPSANPSSSPQPSSSPSMLPSLSPQPSVSPSANPSSSPQPSVSPSANPSSSPQPSPQPSPIPTFFFTPA